VEDIKITTIKPSGSGIHFDPTELIRHRELLYFLTLRDIKIRYKQTAIGILWAVLQPVLTVAIFTIIFSRFAQFDTGNVPYSLLALSGLILWLFVQNSTTLASSSFISNTNLVTKVYFPRIIMPLSATFAGLIDLCVGLVILVLFMFYYDVALTSQIIFAPVFVLLTVVLTASIGTLFSALNVRFRDIKFALPFMLQVWMIASPVFYPSSIIAEKWRLIFAINPLTGIVEGFRCSLFGNPVDWQVVGISVLSLAAILLLSLVVFKWMEDDFADIV